MVLGWFARLVVVAAVIGVLGFDGISLAISHLGAHEDADNAATDAATAWRSANGAEFPSQAMVAATAAAKARLVTGETLVANSIRIAADGTVTLEVQRTTEHTLLAHDVGALKHLVTFDVQGSGTPATSS